MSFSCFKLVKILSQNLQIFKTTYETIELRGGAYFLHDVLSLHFIVYGGNLIPVSLNSTNYGCNKIHGMTLDDQCFAVCFGFAGVR